MPRAYAHSEAADYDDAIALLDSALQRDPSLAAAHTARGWALENLDPPRMADARLAYETALAIDARELWAAPGLATMLAALGEVERCAPLYRGLMQDATPRCEAGPELLELLGWSEYRLGRHDAAAAVFQRALAVDPDWISVRFDSALIALLRGDDDGVAYHAGHALGVLATRPAAARAAALKVARNDLADALRMHPQVDAGVLRGLLGERTGD